VLDWPKHNIDSEKSFCSHPMELLGDVVHVESRFDPFGDSVCVSAGFAPNVPWAQKTVWTHLMTLLGDEPKWKLDSVRLEIVLISHKIGARFGPNVP
jgi:hypothetical protein